MNTYNIFTDKQDTLLEGKADFLLACSVTKTCTIDGITQAGIDGLIPLTPTLDAEYISNETIYSLTDVAKTKNGIPTPAIVTKAIDNICPFSTIEILDLGLEVKPQNTIMHHFYMQPSKSITDGADIDAKDIFIKGMEFGEKYELKGNYLILGESTPSGTTTATTSALALGYDIRDDFASSFATVPHDIKNKTIDKALKLIDDNMTKFEKLGILSDNMLIFCAGFLVEASKRFHIVLAGGTQMATCLLIADSLREDILKRVKTQNITLATTKWLAKDKNSNIKNILSKLSYTPHAVYTEFSFKNTSIDILKRYDNGDVKEGAGMGGALAYATSSNIITQEKLLEQIEYLIYSMM
jgi:uncharacterized protein (TIGR00303 family)